MGQCQLCKKEVDMPFTCSYCNQTFCSDHRLPEEHQCPALPQIRDRKWPIKKNSPKKDKNPPKQSPQGDTATKPSISTRISAWYKRTFTRQEWSYGRNRRSRYSFAKTQRTLRKYITQLFEITAIIFLSLPLYLAYLVDSEISRDPFSAILLQDYINETVFFPVGVFVLTLLYLIYRRMSGYKLKFEWVLLGVASVGSTYFIHRFLSTMSVFSMLLQSNPSELPSFVSFYEDWARLLFQTGSNVIRMGYAKSVEYYDLALSYLQEKYSELVSR